MKTVNVIEITDVSKWQLTVHSFPETDESNSEAEALFKELIKETAPECIDPDNDDWCSTYLDDGICEVSESAAILIVHSEE